MLCSGGGNFEVFFGLSGVWAWLVGVGYLFIGGQTGYGLGFAGGKTEKGWEKQGKAGKGYLSAVYPSLTPTQAWLFLQYLSFPYQLLD